MVAPMAGRRRRSRTTVTQPAGDYGRAISLREAVHRTLLAASMCAAATPAVTPAAELPVACIAGSCGANGPSTWVSSGSASAVSAGNTLTINQASDRAILNWASFNVSADGHVVFQQPARTSIALNRIYQASPSRIFGQVTANGEIYLVNPNGVIFGKTAVINASGILASTLNMPDDVFTSGIAAPGLAQNAIPALQSDGRLSVLDADGNPIRGTIDDNGNIVPDPNGQPIEVKLTLQNGAKLATTNANGRILLASQSVDNAGSITAADGQVILAAGDKVFLQASTDAALRGLLVEVGAGGTTVNRATGEISTPRGNSTLIGLAVNQQGRISATTTVAANGSIRLLARDQAAVVLENGAGQLTATHTGTLELGAQSVTSVVPELNDTQTAVDDQAQLPSTIEAMGHQVTFRSGSTVRANGGLLEASALLDPRGPQAGVVDPDSQLRVESGAVIDLSGSDATVPMSRNQVTVELRSNELRDSPNQRDSAIRGQPLLVDARVGTPLGDISGAIAAIPKSIAERTAKGGTAVFASDGDVVTQNGSQIKVSGGVINYDGGVIQTSQLIGADGKLYDIGTADPGRTYVGVVNPTFRQVDDRWGHVTVTALPNIGRFEPGYVEGKSAGTVQFAAPNLLLNGRLDGTATTGPFQRNPGQIPDGGKLIIGLTEGIGNGGSSTLDYRAPSVAFAVVPPTVVIANGAPLGGPRDLLLPLDYLRNGFTRTEINSNGSVTIPEDAALQLAPGSTFQVFAQHIAVDSDITNLGGQILLTTRDTGGVVGVSNPTNGIEVGSGVTLDVRGTWSNDFLLPPGVRPTDPLLQNGGSISLTLTGTSANPELILGDDITLRASAGAHVTVSGSTVAGRGGSIGLQASRPDTSVSIGSNPQLDAFGVLGASGGSFTLSVPAIQLVQDDAWVRAQRFDPHTDNGFLHVGSGLFANYGFSKFTLAANSPRAAGQDEDIVQVASDVRVQAEVSSLILDTNATQRAGGGVVESFSSVFLPLPHQRSATSVTLRAGQGLGDSGDAGNLTVLAGAALSGEPGSSFTFSSTGSLFIDGVVSAPSGSISASVLGPPSGVQDTGFNQDQQLRIGPAAVLDVAGKVVLTPNDSGLLRGRVLPGGAVSLTADRGSVNLAAGSKVDVSGTSGAFDLPGAVPGVPIVRHTVASAAGSVLVGAREGVSLFGDVRAFAGQGDSGTAAAGSLTVQAFRATAPANVANPFPQGSAVIRLTTHDEPVALGTAPGFVGVSTDFIRRSGFDAITLSALDQESATGGEITLDSGVELALARQITLDAPLLSMAGDGTTRLSATYVSLGNSALGDSRAASTPGEGTLQVKGEFIELIGSTVLSSMKQASLDSTGDIRLRGTVRADSSLRGDLTIAGDLSLGAGRIYGSTLTQFTLQAAGGANDRVQITQTGSANGLPLSASSSLRIRARDIEQGGTLLAPFGSIALDGTDAVNLLSGSLTSVSGAGALIPFGAVSNGVWTYGKNQQTERNFESLPDRRVAINGNTVAVNAGAVINVSGGGDLYAYEWVPGTGGSRDALAPGVTPGLYAIIPSLGETFAPFDSQEFAASDLKPGDSIYISGGAGVAAGVYALLPARYALMPGAFLVSAVAGTADLVPGSVSSLADGTRVIAGYRTFADTQLGSTQLSGFAIRPGSFGRELAQYDDFKASDFLAQHAARLELGRVSLPADAGSLSLFVGTQLTAAGDVRTAPATNGAGATIDVSGLRLAVTASGSDGDATTVDIGADKLAAWNPARLILGGRRTGDATNSLAVTADDVVIRDGAQLAFGEVLVAGRNTVTLEDGSSVASRSGLASGAAPTLDEAETLTFADGSSAGAAVIIASDFAPLLPDRSGATGAGTINLSPGASISTRGALTLDAPGGGTMEAQLQVAGAHAAIGAAQLVFGDSPQAGAITLDATLEGKLEAATTLRLAATQSIQFLRETSVQLVSSGASTIEFSAPQLSAGVPGINVNVAASQVILGGTDASPIVPVSGTAQLDVNAGVIELGGGALSVSGFGATSLAASDHMVAHGAGHLSLSGDLSARTPVISVAHDAETLIEASTGNVQLQQTAAQGSLAQASAVELGGALSVVANRIDDSLSIVAPSGLVSLQAAQQLTLGDTASIDVSGRMVSAGGRAAGSGGGAISLAAGGSLSASSQSSLRLDAAGDSDAGRLFVQSGDIVSLAGALSAQHVSGAGGGRFELEALSVANFGGLNSELESSGFDEVRSVHVRTGDLELPEGSQTTARSIELVTDSGAVRASGALRTESSDLRGSIRLYGGAGVVIASSAQISTDAAGGGEHGGDIELGTSTGGNIDIAAASRISAHGPVDDGALIIRTPVVGTDVALSSLPTSLANLGRVVIAPVFAADASAAPTATELSTVFNAANDFVTNSGSAVLGRFATSSGAPITLRPDIELRRNGDMVLGSLDLTTWRFLGEPGTLTVRATGSVVVSGTVSDGFQVTGTGANQRITLLPDASTTIHVAAGADLASVDPQAIDRASSSDLLLDPNARLRTGSGEIVLNAARDLVFGSGASVYTGGLPGADLLLLPARVGTTSVVFPDHGGNVELTAGRDVIGSPVTQSVTDWQFRGTRSNNTSPFPQLWGITVATFGWNAGTLGGGDLLVRSGRDISNLSAATADSARVTNGSLARFGGGSMQISAGGDFASGDLFGAAGSLMLEAGGSLSSARTSNGLALGSLLWLGDTEVRVAARRDVQIESVLNPTTLLMPNGPTNQVRSAAFFTYGDHSSLRVQSANGGVTLENTQSRVVSADSYVEPAVGLTAAPEILAAYPGKVSIAALSGDIAIENAVYMFPSALGQLDLFAGEDITTLVGGRMQMSDGAADGINTVFSPGVGSVSLVEFLKSASASRHLDDPVSAQISAGRDIRNIVFTVPKATRLRADRDLVDTTLLAQNLSADDVTLVNAGRDITYAPRNQGSQISVGGPGRLDVLAGRDVDLGFTQGITTTGRLRNPSIPIDVGADITVMAGIGSQPDYANFIDTVIAQSTAYEDALVAYVEAHSPTTPSSNGRPGALAARASSLTFDEALATFRTLDAETQRPFIDKVFFSELVGSGRDANAGTGTGFDRGYAAIDALFPGSRDPATNTFHGDLNMSFSRIYSLAGGNIALLVPGGLVNVGLANPPTDINQRDPSLLGIVAQRTGDVDIFTDGDVLVNQSRIFTLLGGDIAVWSTHGNIDAGRGAKSSLSAPPPTVVIDASGKVTLDLSAAVAGSGIRTIVTGEGVKAGDVDLIAPTGFVNAGDAGIGSAGNLNIAARTVVGLDNIQVGGASTGVPAETSGLGASLSGVSGVAASTQNTTNSAAEDSGAAKEGAAPMAQSALSWLDVFVVGLGEENCKQDDTECLKRQKTKAQ